MINIETIKFIAFLNDMAEKTKEGFYPFSTVIEKKGILYNDEEKYKKGHKIIADYLVACDHHDIISTYTDVYERYGITIVVITEIEGDDDIDPYIEITFDYCNECIIIEDGRWHFV